MTPSRGASEFEALVERWRKQYNMVRPHSSLGYRPPAPVAREGDGAIIEMTLGPCETAVLLVE